MPQKTPDTRILTYDELQRAQAAGARPRTEVVLTDNDKTEELRPLKEMTPPVSDHA